MLHVVFSILLTGSLLVCPLRCAPHAAVEPTQVTCGGGCCSPDRDASPDSQDGDPCRDCICHGAVNEVGEEDLGDDGRLLFELRPDTLFMSACLVAHVERSLDECSCHLSGRAARLEMQSLLL